MATSTTTWPFGDPPTVDFGIEREESSIETAMESGRLRKRQVSTKDKERAKVVFQFDDVGFEMFKAFVYHELSSGADWFTMSLQPGGGYRDLTVRMVGGYSVSYLDVDYWNVSFVVEFDDPQQANADAIAYAVGLGLNISTLAEDTAVVESAGDDFHEYIHTDLVADLS